MTKREKALLIIINDIDDHYYEKGIVSFQVQNITRFVTKRRNNFSIILYTLESLKISSVSPSHEIFETFAFVPSLI